MHTTLVKNKQWLRASSFMVLILTLPRIVYADYVLPYPSHMPGSKLYKISRIIDRAKRPFYYGNISSFKYYMALSDKHFVEAKTLFEYKQYLLARDALFRSDSEFADASKYLKAARREGKDVGTFEQLYVDASEHSGSILSGLIPQLPESFLWEPEKTAPTPIQISDLLKQSVLLREMIAAGFKRL